MRRNPSQLQAALFDLVVVGGGITGACMAHDAALRGLSVALIEQDDFGGATSAACSKIVHGGLRYLREGRIAKLRESARERAAFRRLVPHHTRTVAVAVPCGRGASRIAYAAGSAAYRLLALGSGSSSADEPLPGGGFCSREELVKRVPALADRSDVGGAQLFPECQLYSPERTTLAFVASAARSGAVVANHVAAEGLLGMPGRVQGVRARDRLTQEAFDIRARLVANASGPWISRLNGRLQAADPAAAVRWTAKGVHIVTPPLTDGIGMALLTARRAQSRFGEHRRHVFVYPWRGRALIGATNSPFVAAPEAVAPAPEDVEAILADVNHALPGAGLRPGDVHHAFAGLYPVEDGGDPSVYRATGHFHVIDHGRHGGPIGLFSVVGKRFTTARRLAELAVDAAVAWLGVRARPCRTHDTPLPGGDIGDPQRFRAEAAARLAPDLPADVVDHLVSAYGTDLDAVVALGRERDGGLRPLAPGREAIEAEVVHAVRHEMAVRLSDVIMRRTGLGTLGHPGEACLRRVARLMGQELGWSPGVEENEIALAGESFYWIRNSDSREETASRRNVS